MAYKDTLKSKTNRVAEVGRSMTEMLGVLAVIGVLSIAALTGYRMAMNSYHANELLNNVRLMAANVIQREEIVADATGLINSAEFNPTVSYPMKAEIWNDTADLFVVVADDIQKGVCKSALDKVDDSYAVYVFNDEYVDGVRFDNNNDICDDTNQMQFLFNNTGLCEPTCPTCCGGTCCKNDEICYEGTHECVKEDKCNWETQNLCGGECCTKGNSCCGGTCCDGESECAGTICCGQDANGVSLVSNGANCACPSPRVLNTETNKCECASATDSFFEGRDRKGHCCPATYSWIDSLGRCAKLECPNGDGGSCSLDGVLCGYNCTNTNDATKISCRAGSCRADLCADNQTFERSGYGDNGSKIFKSFPGGYYWGCRIEKTQCYELKGGSYFCYNDSNIISRQCCAADSSGTCHKGLCDKNYCVELSASAVYTEVMTKGAWTLGGCAFDNGLKCYPKDVGKTSWTCFTQKNILCSESCTNPPDCGAACDDPCAGQGQYDDNGYCCVTHATSGKTICQKDNLSFYFKNETTYDLCGIACSNSGLSEAENGNYTITGINCVTGWCEDKGCPTGWTYKKSSSYWGCSKDSFACYSYSSYAPALCYYSDSFCGSYCNMDATECNLWNRTECAPLNEYGVHACVYGTVPDEGCWCAGDIDEATGKCCPPGQIIIQGTCQLILE